MDLRKEIAHLKLLLSNCAYWAANGLNGSAHAQICITMLENILKECEKYAISKPGYDSNIMYKGFEYTYIPAAGFLPSQIEWMDNG